MPSVTQLWKVAFLQEVSLQAFLGEEGKAYLFIPQLRVLAHICKNCGRYIEPFLHPWMSTTSGQKLEPILLGSLHTIGVEITEFNVVFATSSITFAPLRSARLHGQWILPSPSLVFTSCFPQSRGLALHARHHDYWIVASGMVSWQTGTSQLMNRPQCSPRPSCIGTHLPMALVWSCGLMGCPQQSPQSFASICCRTYWQHPLVWWAWMLQSRSLQLSRKCQTAEELQSCLASTPLGPVISCLIIQPIFGNWKCKASTLQEVFMCALLQSC